MVPFGTGLNVLFFPDTLQEHYCRRDYGIKATLPLKLFYLAMEDAIFTFQESLRANNVQFKTGMELGDGPLTPKSTKTEVCSGVKIVRSCDIAGLACTYSERETFIQGYVHSKQFPCWYLVVLRCPPSSPIESAVYSCVCKAKDRKTRCSHACAIIFSFFPTILIKRNQNGWICLVSIRNVPWTVISSIFQERNS